MRAAIISALNRVPGLMHVLRLLRSFIFHNVSANYVNLQGEQADAEGQRLRDAWQNNILPQRQRDLVDLQLQQYRSGESIDVFDVFVSSLRILPDLAPGASLLEVGCSSGFYSEVIGIAGLSINYSGCDYSEAFIRLAREKYPSTDFAVEDAVSLHYADHSFDIVVSGCCLLHIPEYTKGIEETARVARQYAIFHRTPVVWGQPERWYRKKAYGVESLEIHFNEPEFLALLSKNGLELISTYTLSEDSENEFATQGSANRTYVCRKTSDARCR